MKTSLGVLNVIMTVIFLLSVLVQYNDPDALVWMAMYGAAAAACITFTTGRTKTWFPLVVAAVAAAWALALAPSFWGRVSFSALFGSFEMKSHTVEHAREFGGLLMIAVWMVALSVFTRQSPTRTSGREVGEDAPR